MSPNYFFPFVFVFCVLFFAGFQFWGVMNALWTICLPKHLFMIVAYSWIKVWKLQSVYFLWPHLWWIGCREIIVLSFSFYFISGLFYKYDCWKPFSSCTGIDRIHNLRLSYVKYLWCLADFWGAQWSMP
jgi:hypothetical protein